MRSHAKAATAGSTKRLGKSKPALLLCVLAAAVAALALVVGSASGATTRFLVETFGSSAQPTFPGDRGMAVDQATGELYVLETNTDEIRRYDADGTPSDFSALGSNVIDGEGAEDETPDVGLAIAGSRSESQIAIDESGGATDGNIYVTESSRDQVSIFSSTGAYLGELSEHSGGAFNEPLGVAVDPSGNVYVGDFSSADLIHKYEPAASPPVNADNTASFNTLAGTSSIGTLTAGAGATAGFIFVNRFNGELFKLDSSTGELKYQLTTGAATVSVDPTTGHVFVAKGSFGSSEVAEYDASGATEATLVSAFKPGSTVEGVAVKGSTEEVYVSRSGTESVEVFGPAAVIPDVVTSPPSSNTGVRATLAGTVNPDGVELDECFFEWGQGSGSTAYTETTPCAETPAEIGAGTAPVVVHADINGLIPQGTNYHYRLVAVNPNATVNGANQNFTTPDTVITTAASGASPTEVTLNGTVNPDGTAITECLFEWGPEKGPFDETQLYPESAPCVPGPGGIGAGTSPIAVNAELSGLHPGTRYAYRLKAANADGTILGDQLIAQTTGPAILATWVENVVYTEATLKAEIDPEGQATTYRFEYGETTSYGQETPELNVGSDSSAHEVSRLLDGLQTGTTYHYRVVATNGVAANEGPDRIFTTFERVAPETDCPNQEFRTGFSATLPDCRAYEMVSPVDKNGVGIEGTVGAGGSSKVRSQYLQTALDGNKFTYTAIARFGDQLSGRLANQYMATRGPGGWRSEGINAPLDTPNISPSEGEIYSPWGDFQNQYKLFTPDLSAAWMTDHNRIPLTPDAGGGPMDLYRRDNPVGTYEALTKAAPSVSSLSADYHIEVQGHSADFDHVVISAPGALTPDAAPTAQTQVYDYSDGELHLVSVMPGGTVAADRANVGTVFFGGSNEHNAIMDNAVSEAGSRIFWTLGAEGGPIFVRKNPGQEQSAIVGGECIEPAKACTLPVSGVVSGGNFRFWAADTSGSTALIMTQFSTLENPVEDLYEVDVDSGVANLIAGEVKGVLGAADDLSRIYYVSRESLDTGATTGKPNLYVHDEGADTFIVTLSEADTAVGANQTEQSTNTMPSALYRTTRVTEDGAHLAFVSNRSLTGYDNTDANNGNADREVFLYDAEAGELICASCNPSGARPTGQRLREPYGLRENLTEVPIWAAAWLPTQGQLTYASRALSESGRRLFFNSFDALVPQDTNGAQDVYQWEAQGEGTCAQEDGCISLISTGQSPVRSEFVDATPGGESAFLETESSIDPRDQGLRDIYVAREGGGFPPPPPPPPPCLGDACQAVPAAPNDPTPTSAGFRGAGDPVSRRDCSASVKRAAKLRRMAKRASRAAKRSSSTRRTRQLRKRTRRYARQAKRMGRSATRCRRANRRAAR